MTFITKSRRKQKMSDSKAKAKWIKENTTVIAVKLNHHTDAELLNYIKDEPSKAGIFKRSLREYMINHPKED